MLKLELLITSMFSNKYLPDPCHHNSRYIVHPDNSLTIRAKRSIKRGEEVTIQYISFLFGNSRRREEIKSCWFFECGCPRCSSISELGMLNISQLQVCKRNNQNNASQIETHRSHKT